MLHIHMPTGKKLYGQVDCVEGFFYVATLFYFAGYIPLMPLCSYLVIHKKGKSFMGKKIRPHPKSILTGYLRGWAGAIAVFATPLYCLIGSDIILRPMPYPALIGLPIGAGLFGFVWFVLLTRRRSFLIVEAALHVFALCFWLACDRAFHQDAEVRKAIPHGLEGVALLTLLANGALLVYSLTRFLSTASLPRALALAEELGISPKAVLARFDEGTSIATRDHANQSLKEVEWVTEEEH